MAISSRLTTLLVAVDGRSSVTQMCRGQAFGDFVKAEVERWSAIARTTGLPME